MSGASDQGPHGPVQRSAMASLPDIAGSSPRPVAASPEAAGRPPGSAPSVSPAMRQQRIALVDLLDRVLAGGVVVKAEVKLSIADVDLVTISLEALISSVSGSLARPDDSGAASTTDTWGNGSDA